jgi:hypothetical protein
MNNYIDPREQAKEYAANPSAWWQRLLYKGEGSVCAEQGWIAGYNAARREITKEQKEEKTTGERP